MQVGADRTVRVRSASKPDRIEIALAYLIDPLQQLVDVVVLRVQVAPGEPPTSPATQPVVSLRLHTPLGEVELFTVIATLGAPLDVTAANLAIETFLPMDPESAARLAELSAGG